MTRSLVHSAMRGFAAGVLLWGQTLSASTEPAAYPAGTSGSSTADNSAFPLHARFVGDPADCTVWDTAPFTLTAHVTNLHATAGFAGELILETRSYLTKQVAQVRAMPLDLPAAGARDMTWTIRDLPPMLYVAELHAVAGGRTGLVSTVRFVCNAANLRAPEPPSDFDEFWTRTLAEQAAVPPDLQIKKVRDAEKHEVLKFSFAGLLGQRCFGWLTVPRDKSRKWPAVLVLPPAGMRSQHVPLFPDTVGMAININGVDIDLPPDQYDVHTWPAPYLVTGILSRDHYFLRFSYAALVRAAEILAARPEVDAKHISVQGSSQGGGLTIVAAGLSTVFEQATARKPGLCRLDWNHHYLQPPFFPIATNPAIRDTIDKTLRYFEPSHFARRIQCPIKIEVGLADDVTPSVGVFCAFNAIPSKQKTLTINPVGAH